MTAPLSLSHQPTLTIDLTALRRNWKLLNAMSARGSAAVVKANAYGLGVEACAPALRDAGARRFFVATLDEGRTLRAVLGGAPWIGVLEGLSDPAAFREHNLTPVLNTLEQVAGWQGEGAVAIHVDTGMNRLGLLPSELPTALSSATWTGATDALMMSHLATAEDPSEPSNAAQLAAFQTAMSQAGSRGFTPSLINSSGHFLGEAYLAVGMGRPGVALYGANPTPTLASRNPMQPVVTLTAPLIQTRTVEAGAAVGYGGTWVAQRRSHLGVIALGYADGWPRAASDRIEVRLGETLCPQVGRVSMDTVVLDLTDTPSALRTVGTPVTVIGEGLPLERFAEGAQTINYEILTGLSRRAKRAYLSP
jgi:alanine racemase